MLEQLLSLDPWEATRAAKELQRRKDSSVAPALPKILDARLRIYRRSTQSQSECHAVLDTLQAAAALGALCGDEAGAALFAKLSRLASVRQPWNIACAAAEQLVRFKSERARVERRLLGLLAALRETPGYEGARTVAIAALNALEKIGRLAPLAELRARERSKPIKEALDIMMRNPRRSAAK
ncbi:hypothetical protein [Nannocystis exedens]|uniref:hypothetical protein n=1 Tax=Nannocystis exedens TaxID=54 RepID=UPI000BB9FFEA|nr:hypothetical protein [Nannocystis exedens]